MPTYPVFTDRTYDFEFLISEANHNRSREAGLIPVSTSVAAGEVLGKITATDEYVGFDPAGTDGRENVAAISFGEVEAGATATTQQRGLAILVRDAEVNGNFLGWPTGITAAEQTAAEAALAALDIIVRY